MDWIWITTTWSAVTMTVVSAVGIYIALILYTRLAGLRSFSKLSSFDFAMTVAIGSVVATTILTSDPPLLQAAAALATLYALQLGVSHLRVRSKAVSRLVNNRPVLLMENGQMLEDAMHDEEITRGDLIAKLREANVLQLDRVRAVVLETTGDISVLHAADDEATELDEMLLEGVHRS